ncbi:ABC transporter substrate-binding protein [Mesorhizobium sp. VNQ89]|uniref:ABC transporter substrate-binding protein n=1 Tax=Mesorhizobium quangtriensis TaxID=3157709 RepID=UPI0032B7C160
MKTYLRTVSAAALVIATSTLVASAADPITVVGWGGTWDKAYKDGVWDKYTEQTGIPIIQEEWGGEVAKVRAQVQAGNVTYDVVSVEAPAMEIGCAEGLFVPLTREVTGDPENYLPGTLHECGVASDTWSTIMTYNTDVFKDGSGPKTWADFWDVEKFPGKRGLYSQAQFTLENALMADGVKGEDMYKVLSTPEGVDRAFAMLDKIKPHVVWWSTTTQGIQNLDSGEVVMSDAFNARITNEVVQEKKPYTIVWDAGFFYGTDFWAVVKGAPHEKEGVDLLKWFSIPENQAGFSKLYAYGTGRKEAAALIPAEWAANLPTSDDHIKFATAYDNDFWTENKEALEERFKAWQAK